MLVCLACAGCISECWSVSVQAHICLCGCMHVGVFVCMWVWEAGLLGECMHVSRVCARARVSIIVCMQIPLSLLP